MKIKTIEMEVALADHFKFFKNLMVTNISWGLAPNGKHLHECDILLLTNSGYLWEIEIKVSKADLINDKKKSHGHLNDNIKRLYFAIPDYIKDYEKHIPDRAGIIIVRRAKTSNRLFCRIERPAINQKGYKLKKDEKHKMAVLGSMRAWSSKRKLMGLST